MSGALLRLRAVGVVVGLFAISSAARAESAEQQDCATAITTPSGLTTPLPGYSYPRYAPVAANPDVLLREDLTPVLDLIAGVHVNSMVCRRLVPVTAQSPLSRRDIPDWVHAILKLDESAKSRVRMDEGRTEFGGIPVLVTDLDGDMRAFDLDQLKEYSPGRKTFVQLERGRVVRISKSRYQINLQTGRTVRRVELLPEVYKSLVIDKTSSAEKADLQWMVGAKFFTPLEWKYVRVGHGWRRGWINDHVPVIVFDVAGQYMELTEQRHDLLFSEHERAEKWIGYKLHRILAVHEPWLDRPIKLANGRVLVAHTIPHPSDALYRVRAVEVIGTPKP